MLVNIHKLVLSVILISLWNGTSAQEVWTLEQCLDTAQVYNKSLRIHRNNISIGEQRQKEAQASAYPKIGLNADYKYFANLGHQLMPLNTFNPQAAPGEFKDVQFGVPHNMGANVQLAMPLYNSQVTGAIRNTQIATELTQLQYQKTEEQVLYDVTTLYYNAQIMHHQMIFLDSNLSNTNTLLQNIRLLKEQLLATRTDVEKVQLQAEQLATQRENVANKYLQALNSLKLLMGISQERDIQIDTSIHEEHTVVKSTAKNLDLTISETQHKFLKSELKTLQQSTHLPSASLVASYRASGFGYHSSANSFLKFYPVSFIGVQLSYTLFDGSISKRRITQKKLEIVNNEMQSQLIADKQALEVENTQRQLAVAQSTILHTRGQIALAEGIYTKTVLQQKQGVATLTDVLLADNGLREAQQNYLNAVVDYLKAELELKRLRRQLKIKN